MTKREKSRGASARPAPRGKPARALIPIERIQSSIYLPRGEKALLDATLAEMYGVEPRALLQAVRRNIERFPVDFMFQVSAAEDAVLKSQSVISSRGGYGGRRHRPYAFTEQGVAMLSSVLRSERAVRVNVEIMRTFARFRKLLATHQDPVRRLDELESKYDRQFHSIFDAIRALMEPVGQHEPAKPPIGFRYVPREATGMDRTPASTRRQSRTTRPSPP